MLFAESKDPICGCPSVFLQDGLLWYIGWLHVTFYANEVQIVVITQHNDVWEKVHKRIKTENMISYFSCDLNNATSTNSSVVMVSKSGSTFFDLERHSAETKVGRHCSSGDFWGNFQWFARYFIVVFFRAALLIRSVLKLYCFEQRSSLLVLQLLANYP